MIMKISKEELKQLIESVVKEQIQVPGKIKVEGRPSTFWIVKKPTLESTVDDICFETDFAGLMNLTRGGLKEEDIHTIYISDNAAWKAKGLAEFLIKNKEFYAI